MLTLRVVCLIGLSVVTLSDNHGFTSGQLMTNNSDYHCQPLSSGIQKCNYYSGDYTHTFIHDNRTYLRVGYCVTYDEETKISSHSPCSYFQPNGFTVYKEESNSWYIQIPDNISEINDYMCGPLNRKGRVCSECMDGFGPAISSIGFQVQCSNCSGVWYGVLLYMFVEIVPVTSLYFAVILVFQINITSAPMICFIMYSQLIPIWWNALDGEDLGVNRQMFILNHRSEFFRKLIIAIYDTWNLRFFRVLVPPFCISSKLKSFHFALFGYISIFYPIILILVTWLFIKLHDRNFKLLVWLWRPMRRCFTRLRRGWNKKGDLIDVFSMFFLLSFSKVMYQTLLFTSYQTIWLNCCGTTLGSKIVTNIDLNVAYGSPEHLMFAIPAVLLCCAFNILPAVVLFFYPIKVFRTCLSKCRIDGLALNTFVEKFYGCYRNGLDGGRDMRSFAGLYFILRPMIFISGLISNITISIGDPYLPRSVLFVAASLLIALCRPYNKMYMTVLDSLLLAHLGILCHMISSYPGFHNPANFVYLTGAMVALPFVCFVLFLTLRTFQKVLNFTRFSGRCKILFCIALRNFNQKFSMHTVPLNERPLVDSNCSDYGAMNVN